VEVDGDVRLEVGGVVVDRVRGAVRRRRRVPALVRAESLERRLDLRIERERGGRPRRVA